MKKILYEKHPTEPNVWEILGDIQDEWAELPHEYKKKLLPVLDLIPAIKIFGIYHIYELTDDEYFSVLRK